MDIKEFSYILAIVDNGNISKAAQSLYISQPSLSIFLKNLESRLGFSIFERRGGRLELTYEGERYVSYARRIAAINGDLEKEIEDIKQNNIGRIRIGVMLSRGMSTLPILLPELKKQFPNIEISIVEDAQEPLEQKLENGEIDIAFINYPFISERLEYVVISNYTVVLAAPKTMNLSRFAENRPGCPYPFIKLGKLDSATPYILIKEGRSLRDSAEKFFKSEDIVPNVLLETGIVATAYRTANAGLGATFIFDSLYKEDPLDNVEIFSVGDSGEKSYVAAYLSDRKNNKLLKMIFDASVEILRKSKVANPELRKFE